MEGRLGHRCAMHGEAVVFAFANVHFGRCLVGRRSRDKRHWESAAKDGVAFAPLRRMDSFCFMFVCLE